MFDSLGDRMKNYERAFDAAMPLRMPVVIRVDGRAFHTYTRGLARPFDESLMLAMDGVALALCREIQGARLAYVQSDEVSVLVNNYENLESQAWFGNRIQKTVSIAASLAASEMTARSIEVFGHVKQAQFDARVFILPEAEYVNYFLWRQQDWTRNSIQMLARSLYSHKQCHEKDQSDLQELCFQKGHNWNDLSTRLKRGRCAVRRGEGERSHWAIDNEIPIWKGEGRAYIERAFAPEPPQLMQPAGRVMQLDQLPNGTHERAAKALAEERARASFTPDNPSPVAIPCERGCGALTTTGICASCASAE